MPLRERRERSEYKRQRTLHHHAEPKRNPTVDRYHIYSEFSPESMLLTEGSGRVIAMNASARKQLGYSRQDILEMDLDSLGAPAIRERLGEFHRLGRARAEGSALRKDGERLEAVFNVAALGDGSFQFLLSGLRDGRLDAELLFERAPLPLIFARLTLEGLVVQGINHQARSLCGGGGRDDFAGRDLAAILPGGGLDLAKALRFDLDGRASGELVWAMSEPEGRSRVFKVRVTRALGVEGGGLLELAFLDVSEESSREESLAALAKDRTLLLQESQHRVKNSLSLLSSILSLQRASMSDQSCAGYLLAAQLRIQTIAQFHDRLSRVQGDKLKVELGSYLVDLVESIKSAYVSSEKPIEIRTDIPRLELDAKRVATIGLIVNELITNSLKYAFIARPSGTVWLKAEESKGRLSLRIADDGVGLLPAFDWHSSQGLGFQFIHMLSQQLAATVELGSGPGFSFSMEMKA